MINLASLRRIEYYLSRALPRGAVVHVLYPKEVLESLLPRLAEEKNLSFVVEGGSSAFRRLLAARGFLKVGVGVQVDVSLIEPSGFGEFGAWVLPSESGLLVGRALTAVVSEKARFSFAPAECDLVQVERVVSEEGIVRVQ